MFKRIIVVLTFSMIAPLIQAQEGENTAKIVILMSGSKLVEDGGKEKPVLVFSTENKRASKGVLRNPGDFDRIDLILLDSLNPQNNKEMTFGKSDLTDGSIIFEFQGKLYEMKVNAFGAKLKELLAADSAVAGKSIKAIIAPPAPIVKSSRVAFNCRNHTPPHRYIDASNILKTCCFVVGCGKD